MPNKFEMLKNRFAASSTKKWYRMEAKNDVADVFIYDEIGWFGVSAQEFVKDLNALNVKTVRLHLNTPGGSVFDGVAIYNALKQHAAKVETYIEGLAASSGSIVALAGDTVYMAENAFYMIHEPYVLAIGDSNELRKTADVLDKIRDTMVTTYIKASGSDEEQIKQWIADETWFTAEEAKAAGFVDEITEEVEAAAGYDLSVYGNVPENLLAEFGKNSGKGKNRSPGMSGTLNVFNSDESLTERGKIMPKESIKNLTLDELKAERSDLFEQVFAKGKADGEKTERDAFARVVELCEGDNELAVKCFTESKTDVEVLQAKNAKLAAENAELKNNPPKGKKKVDPAQGEFSDNADEQLKNSDDGGGDEKPKKFMDAVAAYKAEHKCTKVEAVNKCADLYPELHEKMRSGKE